jgi:hypothetical protein
MNEIHGVIVTVMTGTGITISLCISGPSFTICLCMTGIEALTMKHLAPK